jgi:hypothetical protein
MYLEKGGQRGKRDVDGKTANRKPMSRRDWLTRTAAYAVVLPVLLGELPGCFEQRGRRGGDPTVDLELPRQLFQSDPTNYRFSKAEDAFLEELERASFAFFWEQASPVTGQVEDRGPADGGNRRNISSVAATGFGLTALCVGDQRGWGDRKAIKERVKTALRFANEKIQHEHGFFYHFVNTETGERVWKCEVSDIDTCLFLCGALTCRAYFEDAEIGELVTALYERADWTWMLNGGTTLSMGWKPEEGFLKSRWDSYCELMMMYLLGMASPTHALPKESWEAWKRPDFEFQGVPYIGSHAPLFVHQYSHAWFDFRRKHDHHADYFLNSIIATKVHKLWCMGLHKRFPDYSENLWGISASDSAHGYTAWGGPPEMGKIDGSIVPCAASGSLPFLPEETLRVLQTIRERFGGRVWKRYGFVDAFNPLNSWTDPDVIGIDAGITLLMAENARTGFVWEMFMKNAEAQKGMELARFEGDKKV